MMIALDPERDAKLAAIQKHWGFVSPSAAVVGLIDGEFDRIKRFERDGTYGERRPKK